METYVIIEKYKERNIMYKHSNDGDMINKIIWMQQDRKIRDM
jgi:hypothetical protein